MPIALTLMRTSAGSGAGTAVSTNSRTSGPPTFVNLIVRDIGISCVRLLDPPHALALGSPHWFGRPDFQGSRSLDLDVLPEADPVIDLLHPGTRRLVGPGGAPALRSTVGHVVKLHAVRANQIALRLRCRQHHLDTHRFPRKVSVAADFQGSIALSDHLTSPNRLHGDHPSFGFAGLSKAGDLSRYRFLLAGYK